MNIPQAFALALQHHREGRLGDAEALYRQVLAAQPNHAEARHHLGIIAHQLGRHELAVEQIHQALVLNPNNPAAHSNLGGACRALGQCDEAIACFRRAIQLQPDYPEAHNNLGDLLREQGQFEEAIACFRRAIQLRPNYPEAHNNLGAALARCGQFDDAVAAYRRALELRPNVPETYNNLGIAQRERGQPDEAVIAYRRALELQPNYPEALTNLGNALTKLGQLDEGLATYRQALQLQPDYPDAHYNMGATLAEKGQFEEATAAFRRALELKPGYAQAWSSLGIALTRLGQCEDAIAAYRQAIACRPDSAGAHFDLSLLLLLLGHYEEGWREYEWRWRSPDFPSPRRSFSVPQWDGQPATGKTILIHAEQGFGDALLFSRYLPLVPARSQGAKIILECHGALLPLLDQLRGAAMRVVARCASDEMLPPFDLHLPLLSLPLVLQNFAPLPMSTPYLQADLALRAQWRERFGSAEGLRVGLAWAGNPMQNEDRRRSITPEKLAPILRVPGLRFTSLQVLPRAALPPTLAAAGVLDFTPDIANFSDSAALMAELDLVITVDTATAHLAGALGCPAWVLLPLVPYWPYGLGREDTPWYPTMRLFRQSHAGDWEAVIQRMAEELSRVEAPSRP